MADLVSIGVLVPFQRTGDIAPPEARPVGRAALQLLHEDIEVLFGDTLHAGKMSGGIARPGRWETISDVSVAALHDRYPSQMRSEHFSQILDLPLRTFKMSFAKSRIPLKCMLKPKKYR